MKKELPDQLEYTYLFGWMTENIFWSYRKDILTEKSRKEGIGPCEAVLHDGKHLSDWYRDTCYCGRCGIKMKQDDKERAMRCPSCDYVAYPRIMPAVIVGVKNKDRILLPYRTGFAHNALDCWFYRDRRNGEETVKREVMEEAGIRVKNLHYYKSQPWGNRNDILLGFYCEVDGDDTITMDRNELKYAEWVQREKRLYFSREPSA